jgi:hypothetical protein
MGLMRIFVLFVMSAVVIFYSIPWVASQALVNSTLNKAQTTENKELPTGISIKFRIYGLENKTKQAVIFLTGNDMAKARLIGGGDDELLLRATRDKHIAAELTMPSYFVRGGGKFKLCVIEVIEVKSLKLACSAGEYERGSIPKDVTIFMNSSNATAPDPDIWSSIN